MQAIYHFPHLLLKSFFWKKSLDLKDLLKGYKPCFFTSYENPLNLKLHSIKNIELKAIVSEILTDSIDQGTIQEIFTTLDSLASALPLEKLLNTYEISSSLDALKEVQEMLEEAELYLNYHPASSLPSIHAFFSKVFEAFIRVLETLFAIFGIRDLFNPIENESDAFSKQQKVLLIFNLSSMLTSVIIALHLSTTVGSIAIGGAFLFIGTLSLIWPRIKPKPYHLPGNVKNWTQKFKNEDPCVIVRKKPVNKIIDLFKRKRHPLLIGPSQIGKTRTAETFARSLARGDYPELANKSVYYANATELTEQTSLSQGRNTIFNRIAEASGRHNKDIFLILDEFHMLCKNKEKTGDLLKTLLDENADFPFIIGITTKEEYNAYIQPNTALRKRFKCVTIKDTTCDETLEILGSILLKIKSKPLIEPGILDYIYEKSCEQMEFLKRSNRETDQGRQLSQPSASLSLLKKCIQQTESTRPFSIEKKINGLSTKIRALQSEAALIPRENQKIREKLSELKMEMAPLVEQLKGLREKRTHLFKVQKCLNQVTLETYKLSLKINKLSEKKLDFEINEKMKHFILLQRVLRPILEDYIQNQSKQHNIPMSINRELVDAILNG